MKEYINKACECLNLKTEDIFSKSTADKVSVGRYIMWYHLHYKKGYSGREISKIFNRNSNTIFKGIAKIKLAINSFGKYKKTYEDYCAKFE